MSPDSEAIFRKETHEICNPDNWDALEGSKPQQILVTRDNNVGTPRDGTFEDSVVGGRRAREDGNERWGINHGAAAACHLHGLTENALDPGLVPLEGA